MVMLLHTSVPQPEMPLSPKQPPFHLVDNCLFELQLTSILRLNSQANDNPLLSASIAPVRLVSG